MEFFFALYLHCSFLWLHPPLERSLDNLSRSKSSIKLSNFVGEALFLSLCNDYLCMLSLRFCHVYHAEVVAFATTALRVAEFRVHVYLTEPLPLQLISWLLELITTFFEVCCCDLRNCLIPVWWNSQLCEVFIVGTTHEKTECLTKQLAYLGSLVGVVDHACHEQVVYPLVFLFESERQVIFIQNCEHSYDRLKHLNVNSITHFFDWLLGNVFTGKLHLNDLTKVVFLFISVIFSIFLFLLVRLSLFIVRCWTSVLRATLPLQRHFVDPFIIVKIGQIKLEIDVVECIVWNKSFAECSEEDYVCSRFKVLEFVRHLHVLGNVIARLLLDRAQCDQRLGCLCPKTALEKYMTV